MQPLVLDTNVVLDLYVFGDAAAAPVQRALDGGQVDWIATAAMRDELVHVLGSDSVTAWLGPRGGDPQRARLAFDRHARLVPAAPQAPCACRDADDQKFVDLAVAHGALLLSRDRDVLALRRRLQRLGVRAAATWAALQA